MNKPLMKLDVEIWEKSEDFIRYGIPWWMKMIWWVAARPVYKMMKQVKFARGFYDRFRNKIVLCTQDITESVLLSRMAQKDSRISYHTNFALQIYYTLVHEMLHQADVAKDDTASGGHKLDFDRYEKLPEALKDMFDSLLEMEYSNDNFARHPENRRKN
jgi:hypothetical protein